MDSKVTDNYITMKSSPTANRNSASKIGGKSCQSFQNSNYISENLSLSIQAYLLSNENRMIPFAFTIQKDTLTDNDVSHKSNSCVKEKESSHKDTLTDQRHKTLHGNISRDHGKEPPGMTTITQQQIQHFDDIDVVRIVCSFIENEESTNMCELNTKEKFIIPDNKEIPVEKICVTPVNNENSNSLKSIDLNGLEELEHSKSIIHNAKDMRVLNNEESCIVSDNKELQTEKKCVTPLMNENNNNLKSTDLNDVKESKHSKSISHKVKDMSELSTEKNCIIPDNEEITNENSRVKPVKNANNNSLKTSDLNGVERLEHSKPITYKGKDISILSSEENCIIPVNKEILTEKSCVTPVKNENSNILKSSYLNGAEGLEHSKLITHTAKDMCELNIEENCVIPDNKESPTEKSCVKPVKKDKNNSLKFNDLNGVERLENSKSITHQAKDVKDMLYGPYVQKYNTGNSCDHIIPAHQEKEDMKKIIKKKKFIKKHSNSKLLKKDSLSLNKTESESSIDQFSGKISEFTNIKNNSINKKQRNRNRIFKDQIKSAVESYLNERTCDRQGYTDFSQGNILFSTESGSSTMEDFLSSGDQSKQFDCCNKPHGKFSGLLKNKEFSSKSSSPTTEQCLSYSRDLKHADSNNKYHLKNCKFPVTFKQANMKLDEEKHQRSNKIIKNKKESCRSTNIAPEISTNNYDLREVLKNNRCDSKGKTVNKDCSTNTSPSLLLELNDENSTIIDKHKEDMMKNPCNCEKENVHKSCSTNTSPSLLLGLKDERSNNALELKKYVKKCRCNCKKEKAYKNCSTNTSPTLLFEMNEQQLSEQSTKKIPEKMNQSYSKDHKNNLKEQVGDKLLDMNTKCNKSLNCKQNAEGVIKCVSSDCEGIENEVPDTGFTSVTSIRNTPEAVFSHISLKTDIGILDGDETFHETILPKTVTGSQNPKDSDKHASKKETIPLVEHVNCRETCRNMAKQKLGQFNSGDQMAYALYGTSFSPKRTSRVDKEKHTFETEELKQVNKVSEKESMVKQYVDNKVDAKMILNKFNLGNNMHDAIYGQSDCSKIQETKDVSTNKWKPSSSAQNSQIASNNLKLNNKVKIEDIKEMNKICKAEPTTEHDADNKNDTRKILTEFNMGNNMAEMIYGQFDQTNMQETNKINKQTKIINQVPEQYLVLPGVINLIKYDSKNQTAQQDEYSASNIVNPQFFNSENQPLRHNHLSEEYFGHNALGYGSKNYNVIPLEDFLHYQTRNSSLGQIKSSVMQEKRFYPPSMDPCIRICPTMGYTNFGGTAINKSTPKHGYGNTYLDVENYSKLLGINSESSPMNAECMPADKGIPTSSFGNALLDIENYNKLLGIDPESSPGITTKMPDELSYINPAITRSKMNAARSFESKGMADSMGGAPLNMYRQDIKPLNMYPQDIKPLNMYRQDIKPLEINPSVKSGNYEYPKIDNSFYLNNNGSITKYHRRRNENQSARGTRKPRGIVPGLD
ncbi:hypothetical protein JTE90_008094 [Oedothorax gibbosus]|uniref:Exophilin 5 n=1 Tax=Oedothorax gibbosus TaxID=931172 RepID=A0AAV6V2F1_9ARAC|nr:hypothetical protein JTE90_008094 [Oedothorax gibbosus]